MKEALDKYKEQLRQLHELMVAGLDDDEHGDPLRDAMDVSWHEMTEEEINQGDGYSAGLYAMTDHSLIIIETESEV